MLHRNQPRREAVGRRPVGEAEGVPPTFRELVNHFGVTPRNVLPSDGQVRAHNFWLVLHSCDSSHANQPGTDTALRLCTWGRQPVCRRGRKRASMGRTHIHVQMGAPVDAFIKC